MVEEIVRRGEPVALLVADQRMPGMSGVEFLAGAIRSGPARQARAADGLRRHRRRDHARSTSVRLDHYLMKPWSPPEERLYPVLDDLLEDWEADSARAARRAGAAAGRAPVLGRGARHPRLPGPQRRPLPLARRRGARGAPRSSPPPGWTRPSCRCSSSRTARRWCGRPRARSPRRIGLRTEARAPLLRPRHPRRRAGRPGGGGLRRVRGPADAARGAARHGRPGGAELADRELPRVPVGRSAGPIWRGAPRPRPSAWARRCSPPARCSRIRENGPSRVVPLDGGGEIGCHSVLIATGVHYSRLDAPGVEELTGLGRLLRRVARRGRRRRGRGRRRRGRGELGGAGGVDLATRARRVTMLCRGDGLEKSMSHYLVERIELARERRGQAGHGGGHGGRRATAGSRSWRSPSRDGRSACR